MGSFKKITALQAYMTLILTIGVSNHVLLTPLILKTAQRDAWISVLLASPPILILTCIWYLLIRQTGQQAIIPWLKHSYGFAVAWFIRILLILLLMGIALISLKDTLYWTRVSYLPQTPLWATSIALIALCYFAARSGLRSIAIVSGILLPVVVLLGYFVMTINFQYKDYSFLYPNFTHGYTPAIKGALLTFEAFGELILLLFIQHHISTKIRLIPLLGLSVVLIGLTAGPLAGAIAIFGPFEAADLRYPAFEQWRMVSIGKFISHLDFLSIYQWLAGSFIKTSLSIFVLIDLLSLQSRKAQQVSLICITLLLFLLSLLPWSDMSLVHIEEHIFFPLMLAIAILLTLSLFILSWIQKWKSRRA